MLDIAYKQSDNHGVMVELMSPELMFLGVSGQPYRGTLFVSYINKGVVLDMLSFKKFITSLRSEKFLFEEVAKIIYNKLNESLQDNDTLSVMVDLTARGGIQSRTSYGVTHSFTKKPLVFNM
jgi:NADPH-dependent 7-cyano-7-deazaguanine reductase QueF